MSGKTLAGLLLSVVALLGICSGVLMLALGLGRRELAKDGEINTALDTHSKAAGGIVLGLLCASVPALALYSLPPIVAAKRRHPNTLPILILTIMLGWTLVGWAVALVWACLALDAPSSSEADQLPAR